MYGIDLHRYRLLLVPWSEANALTSGLGDNIRYIMVKRAYIDLPLSLGTFFIKYSFTCI